jgi:hypothetical protein
MKMPVSWVAAPYSLVNFKDVLEVPAASIITAMIEGLDNGGSRHL